MSENIKKIPYSLAARVANPNESETEKKVFAKEQSRGTVNLEALADHIAEHTSSFSAGEIMGIVADAMRCTVEFLQSGYRVELGKLGKLFVTISSEGVELDDEGEVNFSTANIKRVNVRYAPSEYVNSQMQQAGFELMPSREQQAAARKAAREQAAAAIGGSTGGNGGDNGGGGNGEITE